MCMGMCNTLPLCYLCSVPEIILIIHDVRSAHNVGSMFRTADAAGVSKIYLTGYTPAPIDKFKRPQKEIAKTALGAEKIIPWESVAAVEDVITKLQHNGVLVVALEQAAQAIDYRALTSKKPIALIVGNEVDGIPNEVLALCDHIIHIPMHGTKESLNVSVAAGIALFHLRNV